MSDDTEYYDCEDVTDLEKIGEGSFGCVYQGTLNHDDTVAIKIIKDGDERAVQREIRRMRRLDHENVVKLLGVVPPESHNYCSCDYNDMEQTTSWLILEYMPNGNLIEYLRNNPGGLPAYGMHKLAYQIAVGMDYLHRNANIVHRDLAARNILVGEDYGIKICDFGLCDDYYQENYYYGSTGRPCPIRWMPPENLPGSGSGSFSRKGDVWSFGVVLYEIWSRGQVPFVDLNNAAVISTVKNGNTVLNYSNLNARFWVVDLMKQCFQFSKTSRPNFRHIYETIEEESEYDLT